MTEEYKNHSQEEIIEKIELFITAFLDFIPERPLYQIDKHRFECLKHLAWECKHSLREISCDR